ncbi:hypothetical protein GSH05_16995 [Burkholderia pseudomallei]|nr:hypothetical protein [Burkholderia pseudomallei]MBM5653308.1 hypothetical protein [Burkholderia pseudomallei]MBM5668422.1 hypothetical protein [Burkholderia pseudomallei]MUU85397.1 hypothetical protein [Burkholderia pseudomallei]MWA22768.1 hypothetical protein [Burkholderia pseudomallei]
MLLSCSECNGRSGLRFGTDATRPASSRRRFVLEVFPQSRRRRPRAVRGKFRIVNEIHHEYRIGKPAAPV